MDIVARFIFFCLILSSEFVSFSTARKGLPIIHCENDANPVVFHFPMATPPPGNPTVVVHPKGHAMLTRYEDFPPLRERDFLSRITTLETTHDTISFTLTQVSASDSGTYVCREGSVTGPLISQCGQTLHFVDTSPPSTTQWGLPVAGQRGVLLCLAGLPQHWDALGLEFLYDWYQDGQHVHRQRHHEWLLSPVRESHQGLYSCRVTETTRNCSSPQKSKEHAFNVAIPPSVSIKRHEERQHLFVPLGRSFTLTCVVESAFPSVPSNGFSWTFSPSDSSPAQQLQDTGDTLVLGPLTREDSGQYTCQARNDQKYKGLIPHGSDSVNVSVIYLEDLRLTPAAVQVKEGEGFTLRCSVDSSPAAQLQWLRDGVPLRDVTANVDDYVVVKATRQDGGNYTCRASNSDELQLSSSAVVVVTQANLHHKEPGTDELKSSSGEDEDSTDSTLGGGGTRVHDCGQPVFIIILQAIVVRLSCP